MKTSNCPTCGAQVQFRSAGSALAVCSYCRSTVLRDGARAEDLGKLSEILDDFSPVQIGTGGKWNAKPFTVMGRLRLKYEDGSWNEWAIEFMDGTQGWLSDASGQFVVTRLTPATPPAPMAEMRVGRGLSVKGQKYVVTDARTCVCTGGEGELPGPASDGKEFLSVDLRSVGGNGFITFDYSDTPPSVYVGEACARADLAFTNLRSNEAVGEATSKLKGGVTQFDCPSCGASLGYHAGFGASIACKSCKSVVALEGDRRTVVLKQQELDARDPFLPLGTKGKLRGDEYEVIGFMSRCDEDGEAWEEYILFSKGGGFLWLTHSGNDWYLGEVLNALPDERGSEVYYAGKLYRHESEYTAKTTFVLGEFNWRVKVNDTASVTEWAAGTATLSRETYGQEVTWTVNSKWTAAAIAAAFGLPAPPVQAKETSSAGLTWGLIIAAWAVAFLLDGGAHLMGRGDFFALIIAAIALWLPMHLSKDEVASDD